MFLGMINLPNITNKYLLYFLLPVSIIFIGIIDWLTGYEIAFSIFYLLPLAFFALYKAIGRIYLLFNSILAALSWFIADITLEPSYSHPFIPYWNAFVRFLIFITVSFLIDELKIRYQQYKETSLHLQQLNEEKNKFIGIAAHDLRNPIGAIRSYSELLLFDSKAPLREDEKKKLYALINKISSHSLAIIKNVLDISSIESGKIELNILHGNYLDLVRHCIDLNNLVASNKGISIVLETDGQEIMFDFDKHYIEEVLDNLIGNAIKYSHPNSIVNVKVVSSTIDVMTEITDTGVGIPDGDIGKLFMPFQKAHSKPTSGESSTGLGLSIVKKIVSVHNGHVGVRSNNGKGSIFYFSLPLDQPNKTQKI
jgi:signal transduction histidine kinase